MFLQDRFLQQGTLSDPGGVPDPTYALPGTLNWMRALAILVDASTITPDTTQQHSAHNDHANPLRNPHPSLFRLLPHVRLDH